MFKHIITAMLTMVLSVSLFGAKEPVVNAKAAAKAPAVKAECKKAAKDCKACPKAAAKKCPKAAKACGKAILPKCARKDAANSDAMVSWYKDSKGCFYLVYDWEKQAQVFARTLDMDAVLEIFEMANSRGFHLQTYDTWDVLVEPRCDDDIIRRYCAFTGMEYRVIGDIRTDLKEAPMKILSIEEEDFAGSKKLQDDIMAALSHKVNTAFSCPTYLETVPAGLNKGEAVKMLCRMMEVPIENAVAAGDAANDLSMIEMAGVGVAMANGTDEVKAAADYITKNDNNHDGIAEIIERFFD